jgi:hypothetical protein
MVSPVAIGTPIPRPTLTVAPARPAIEAVAPPGVKARGRSLTGVLAPLCERLPVEGEPRAE